MDFENVLISIAHKWGDFDFTLKEWMKPSLEESHRRPPYRVRDKASGMELSFSIIPMSYRLDNISKFYINSGICLPPWGTSSPRIWFDKIQSPEKEQSSDKGIKYKIQFGNYTMGFSEKFCGLGNKQFPSTIEMYLSDEHIHIDEMNQVELKNIVSSSEMVFYMRYKKFALLIGGRRDRSYWTHLLEDIIPDINMGSEIAREYSDTESLHRCYVIHNLNDKQMTVMTAILGLPDSEEIIPDMDLVITHRTHITLIALTNGLDRQDTLLKLIDGLTVELN